VERLRRETPASFVAFDLVSLGGTIFASTCFGSGARGSSGCSGACRRLLLLTPAIRNPERAAAWLD
jgi:hypothetical protein